MRQFQRTFSGRAANAFSARICEDSHGMTAIDAKAPVGRIAIHSICGIILMSLTVLFADVQPTVQRPGGTSDWSAPFQMRFLFPKEGEG
jgi:hypothetical protein